MDNYLQNPSLKIYTMAIRVAACMVLLIPYFFGLDGKLQYPYPLTDMETIWF